MFSSTTDIGINPAMYDVVAGGLVIGTCSLQASFCVAVLYKHPYAASTVSVCAINASYELIGTRLA